MDRRFFIAALLIIITGIFFRVYNIGVTDAYVDELIYAQRAEALVSGESGQVLFFDHPPLYWLLSAMMQSYGLPLLIAGRAISALFGVIGVFALMYLAYTLTGKWASILSGIFLSVMSFHVLYSRLAHIDMMLVSLVVLCYALFLDSERRRGASGVVLIVLSAIVGAAATWTKYPGAAVVGVVGLYIILRDRKISSLFRKRNLLFFMIFFFMVAPLVMINLSRNSSVMWQISDRFSVESPTYETEMFRSAALFFGYIGGIVLDIQEFPTHITDYVLILLGLVPFLIAVGYSWIFTFLNHYIRKGEQSKISSGHLLLGVHAAVYSVFFLLYRIKLQYYLLLVLIPVIPAFFSAVLHAIAVVRKGSVRVGIILVVIAILAINLSSAINTISDTGRFSGFRESMEALTSRGVQDGIILTTHPRLISYYVDMFGISNVSVVDIETTQVDGKGDMSLVRDPNTIAMVIKINHFDFYYSESNQGEIGRLFSNRYRFGDGYFTVLSFTR